jgi:hypothetical protein
LTRSARKWLKLVHLIFFLAHFSSLINFLHFNFLHFNVQHLASRERNESLMLFRNGTHTKRVQLDEQLSSRYERIRDAESGTEVLRFRHAEEESGTELRLQAPASALVLSLSFKAGHIFLRIRHFYDFC